MKHGQFDNVCFHDQSSSQSHSPESFEEVSAMNEHVAGLDLAPATATGTLPYSTAAIGSLSHSLTLATETLLIQPLLQVLSLTQLLLQVFCLV